MQSPLDRDTTTSAGDAPGGRPSVVEALAFRASLPSVVPAGAAVFAFGTASLRHLLVRGLPAVVLAQVAWLVRLFVHAILLPTRSHAALEEPWTIQNAGEFGAAAGQVCVLLLAHD